MGFCDIFKAKKNEELAARVAELEALLTPELRDHQRLVAEIQNKRAELEALEKRIEETRCKADQEQDECEAKLTDLLGRIQEAKEELVETDEEALMQTVGLYTPRFDFANSTLYKEQLASVRKQQKEMVRKGEAVTGNSGLSYEGSRKKGHKIVHDIQKLLLRAFNLECDDIVDRVRFNNIDASEKRIMSAKATISKLGEMLGIEVREPYAALKVDELHLAYEFQVKKNEEKERLKQLRAESGNAPNWNERLRKRAKRSKKSKSTTTTPSKKLRSNLQMPRREKSLRYKKKKRNWKGNLESSERLWSKWTIVPRTKKLGMCISSPILALSEKVCTKSA